MLESGSQSAAVASAGCTLHVSFLKKGTGTIVSLYYATLRPR